MSEEKKPKDNDVVLGGNNPLPLDGLVLGGIEGIIPNPVLIPSLFFLKHILFVVDRLKIISRF
jgi:hypothetical protein